MPSVISFFVAWHWGKIIPILGTSNTTVLCINQLRANIGGYGPTEDTVGGKGIKYAATVRMEVRSPNSGMIGTAEKPSGIRSKVKIAKNKLAAPYRTAEPCKKERSFWSSSMPYSYQYLKYVSLWI